jgi:hypothetical protein
MIARRRLKGEIVRVDVLAGRDIACSHADHLSELEDGLVLSQRSDGDLMALGNGTLSLNRSNPHRLARSKVSQRDHDRIGRMELDDG